MRLLHIISNMRPASGGPQEAVRMFLRHTPPGATQQVITIEDLGTTRALTTWLRSNRSRFDGVVVHGLWEPLHLAVLRTLPGHTPYVVYAHGMLDPYFKRRFPLKHLKKWFFWLTVQYWVLRRAHRVVFTTAAERDLATQSFWLHRWTPAIVPLSADQPPTGLATCKEAFFVQHPQLRGKRFLLFLGRIDPKKGCDLLLEAFAQTPSSSAADLHLVLAGPDPLNWTKTLDDIALTHCIEDRVHFPGMLTGPAKWGALAAADAFILPSHQENFGIAVVEALTCGTPALLTHPINIAADLAADNAALVEPDTLTGTQNLITRWLALSPAEQAAMRSAARNSAATRYDMQQNTQALFHLFPA